MSSEQAQLLPTGVFECETPGRLTFGDLTINMKVKERQDDFCDSSSLSRSGYVDIKGSRYDQKGEEKHLFFWMFEKRNVDAFESSEDIPLIAWFTGGPGCSSVLAVSDFWSCLIAWLSILEACSHP
jgi:carboxypeptidase C (cathepsin A)